ncbi:MAG: hypothetical protein AAGE52_28390 [Myxococcota bacterium]
MRVFALCLALAGCDCGSSGGGDAALDGSRADARGEDTGGRDGFVEPPCRTALPVDMLWIIDNSNSMEEEQVSLAENFPVLIEALTNPPDDDGDGEPDFPPITDLRVGIVTTDLGVGDNEGVIGCPPGNGDDGIMVSTSRAGGDCVGVTTGGPPWLQFDGTNTDAFNGDFACLSQLGTNGCGLEQQLEASLQAITTNAEVGGPHEGFLRPDSLVAIVYVTDEDDCSAVDDSIFDPSPAAREELGHLRVRCAQHPRFLHPLDRYTTALRNLQLDRRGDVIVAAITGAPRELTRDPLNIDFDALLDDPRMQFTLDPEDDTRLVPACDFGGVGSAPPGRRIIQVVQSFAESGDGLLASICQPDLSPVMEGIAALVAERICVGPD